MIVFGANSSFPPSPSLFVEEVKGHHQVLLNYPIPLLAEEGEGAHVSQGSTLLSSRVLNFFNPNNEDVRQPLSWPKVSSAVQAFYASSLQLISEVLAIEYDTVYLKSKSAAREYVVQARSAGYVPPASVGYERRDRHRAAAAARQAKMRLRMSEAKRNDVKEKKAEYYKQVTKAKYSPSREHEKYMRKKVKRGNSMVSTTTTPNSLTSRFT